MEWNKFDKDTLTPYEKLGNAAKTFNGETKIFSYVAMRHIALLAYKAGVASQPENPADKRKPIYCGGCGYTHAVGSKCPDGRDGR